MYRNKFGVLIFFLILFASAVFCQAAQAQELLPRWRENLNCDRTQQKYAGVEYCTATIIDSAGVERLMHVIVIDQNQPGVRLDYLLAQGVNEQGEYGVCQDVNRAEKSSGPGCNDTNNSRYYPFMPLGAAVQRANALGAAVVINADYSACSVLTDRCRDTDEHREYREHGAEGLTVVQGQRLDGTAVNDQDNNAVLRPWLAIRESAPLKAEISKLKSDNGYLPEQYQWIYTAFGGAPWLIQNGTVLPGEINNCNNAAGSCYDNATQVAVGYTQDDRWLFFVLAMHPYKLLDLATFMDEKLAVYQAIKLDGGGSSQLWFGGAPDPYITRGDGRPLAQYLVIIAQRGNGIAIATPTPQPTPTDTPTPTPSVTPTPAPIIEWPDLGEWWENSWLNQTWQEWVSFWEELRQARQDWEAFVRNIQDPAWWDQMLSSLLLQCCGLAGLPPAGAAFAWRKHHAKNKS